MSDRIVLDVAHLPTHDFGVKTTMWWGTLGFVVIEATAFVAAIGGYFYLMYRNPEWPIGAGAPELGPGTLSLALLLLSLWPNHLCSQYAKRHDLPSVRRMLLLMCALGISPLVARVFEFEALRVDWNTNAYGSMVWVILGLHTVHLLTDVADTLVLTALMFTKHAHGKRFSDVSDNAFYWDFVVVSWVVLYLVIYWAPRL